MNVRFFFFRGVSPLVESSSLTVSCELRDFSELRDFCELRDSVDSSTLDRSLFFINFLATVPTKDLYLQA